MDRAEISRIKFRQERFEAFPALTNVVVLLGAAALCLIPGFVFSRLHVTDGFLYQVIAYVRLTLPVDHLEAFVKGGYSFGFIRYLPGYPLLLSLLSRLAAISPEQLQFMPIAAVLVPACYFALAYKLFRSFTVSVLLMLYGAYDIGLASHYNVFAYTWTNLLYFGFILISLRLIERRRAADAIVLFILFAGTLFLHYAASLWAIVFIFILNVLWFFQERRLRLSEQGRTKRSSFAMPIAFMVAFFAANQIFYRVWLPSFQRMVEQSSDPLQLFFAKTGNYLGVGTATIERYRFLNPWGQTFGWWRTAEYVLILIPIALWLIKMGKDFFLRRPIRIDHPYYLELTIVLIVTMLVDSFVYGTHSGVNMRYVSLMFPFLTVISLDRLGFPVWFRKALVGSLVTAAIIAYFVGFQYYSGFPPTSYAQTRISADWFLAHQVKGPILSDLDTLGLYLVAGSHEEGFPTSVVYDSQLYASVVVPEECNNTDTAYRFVIVNSQGITASLHGIRNRIYEPLSRHMDGIQANPCLNRIYDDGSISIFSRAVEESK